MKTEVFIGHTNFYCIVFVDFINLVKKYVRQKYISKQRLFRRMLYKMFSEQNLKSHIDSFMKTKKQTCVIYMSSVSITDITLI